MTVAELYEQTIKSLPVPQRLQLATLILNEIPSDAVVDFNDEWSEEDLRDFSIASWSYVQESLGEGTDAQTG